MRNLLRSLTTCFTHDTNMDIGIQLSSADVQSWVSSLCHGKRDILPYFKEG